MSEDHLAVGPLLQLLNHLVRRDPVIVITGKPALRDRRFKVVDHMIHLPREKVCVSMCDQDMGWNLSLPRGDKHRAPSTSSVTPKASR